MTRLDPSRILDRYERQSARDRRAGYVVLATVALLFFGAGLFVAAVVL